MVRLVNMLKMKGEEVYFFSKTGQGSQIINAVTGNPMGGIIGTRDEDYYFRVKYANGNFYPRYEPIDLFYYSVEEAEEHFQTKFSDETKQRFLERTKERS
jgi:hypothetical protein